MLKGRVAVVLPALQSVLWPWWDKSDLRYSGGRWVDVSCRGPGAQRLRWGSPSGPGSVANQALILRSFAWASWKANRRVWAAMPRTRRVAGVFDAFEGVGLGVAVHALYGVAKPSVDLLPFRAAVGPRLPVLGAVLHGRGDGGLPADPGWAERPGWARSLRSMPSLERLRGHRRSPAPNAVSAASGSSRWSGTRCATPG